MYTATLKDRVIEGGDIRWVIEFTNGENTFSNSYIATKYEDVQVSVTNKLAELNFEDTFTLGDPVPVKEEVVVGQKTTAEQAAVKWFKDWRNLQMANELVKNGIITESSAEYMVLKNAVKTEYKPEYLNYL